MKNQLICIGITILVFSGFFSSCENAWMEKAIEPLFGPERLYSIGDTGPGGGIVFYVNPAGFDVVGLGRRYHLEAAPADLLGNTFCSSILVYTDIYGTGLSHDIGWGWQNTIKILIGDSSASAANACRTYTGGGLNDWFLPSLYEMLLLYQNRNIVGGFMMATTYYTSSPFSPTQPCTLNFSNGVYAGDSPFLSWNVRAIRAF